MLKILAIIGISAIMAIGISGEPSKGSAGNEDTRTARPQSDSQNKDQDGPKAPSVIVQVSTQPADTSETNEEKETQRKLAIYTFWLVVFTAVLAIVSMVQGYFLYRQAHHLQTHAGEFHTLAEAAKDNAEAARLNAEAIVRSERPWLIAVPERDSKSLHFYSVKIRNVGRTPARFISGAASYMFAERADQLPLPPNYASPIVLPNQLLIAPSHGFPVPHGYDVSHLLQQPEAPNKTLVIYGRVLYRDTIIPEEVHETRWCFGYVFNANTTPGIAEGGFILTGPSEYTDNT